MTWVTDRIDESRRTLETLLAAPALAFDAKLRSQLPEEPGIYAISVRGAPPGDFLRAGRTKGRGGLRQRVYQNHLMGDQKGNLRSQLVREAVCSDLEHAKQWIKNHCVVQYAVLKNETNMNRAEHFMLSMLRPRLSN